MSGGTSVLALKEDDVRRFLAAKTHVGTTNLDFQMKEYCFKRRSDGEVLSLSIEAMVPSIGYLKAFLSR